MNPSSIPPTPRKARSQAEFRLSCVIADYLARALPSDALWTHFPAGEHRNAITGGRLKRMGLARGWPDYLIICRGKLIGLELKAGSAVSKEQRNIGDGFTANGFAWSIIRSTEEAETFLTMQGIPLRASVLARAA